MDCGSAREQAVREMRERRSAVAAVANTENQTKGIEMSEATQLAVVRDTESPMTATDIRRNVNLIQQVMREVMREGEHYGKIPGCGNKPTLFKAGAEKIMATFRIAPEVVVEDLSGPGFYRYRVKCRAIGPNGNFLGDGIGERSTDETKYAWRAAVSDAEWNATDETRRQTGYKKDYAVKQVRTNPADMCNTCLKMAKKCALVDMTLTVTAASDIFTQDIEDMGPEHGINRESAKAPIAAPQRKGNGKPAMTTDDRRAALNEAKAAIPKGPATGNEISEPQRKRLYAIGKKSGVPDDAVKAHLRDQYGIDSSYKIQRGDYEAICNWVESYGQPAANEVPAESPPPDDVPWDEPGSNDDPNV
jgi:hypothetical protein